MAVESGYWNLYRYDPRLAKEGKNPFQLDRGEISADLKAFLARENRYELLMRTKRDIAVPLQDQLKAHVDARMAALVKQSADTLKKGAAAAATAAAPVAKKAADVNKRIPHKIRAAEERVKDFNEVDCGFTVEEAMSESTRCLNCKKPRCQEACPVHIRIPDMIQAIKAGKMEEAYNIVIELNPLIAVCGRVCPHPCEAKCIRGVKGEPLSIMSLKRVASDFCSRPVPAAGKDIGKKVAIVGSGPAGLACAYHLRKAGVACTIFEQKAVAGGMMALCIPSYRLPRDMLKADIDRVLAMGAELKLNTALGKDITLEQLKKDYDAVVLAIGTMKPKKLNIPGEEAKGVEHVIPFLESINTAGRKEIGKKVVVVGAGFSAMDAVRAARRLGSEATIVYRRERDQMPATKEEVDEAEAEGVKFDLLAQPVEVIVKDGAVAGLKCIRMKLGAKDASGRPAPEPIPGSEFVVECDQVIQAISQETELAGVEAKTSAWNGIEADANGRTSIEKVWAAGDAVTGPKTIVDAVAAAIAATKDIVASFSA